MAEKHQLLCFAGLYVDTRIYLFEDLTQLETEDKHSEEHYTCSRK